MGWVSVGEGRLCLLLVQIYLPHLGICDCPIQPGEQWVEAINRGLEESGVLLLLISAAAVNSAWVRRETNVAIELEQAGKIQFYPLEVQPCDLPPLWRGYQRTPFGGQYEAAW